MAQYETFDFETLLTCLDSDADRGVQEGALAEMRNQSDLNLPFLLSRSFEKSKWENVAKVVIAQKNENLEENVSALLEWLMDRSWPGAERIYARLMSLDTTVLNVALIAAKKRARKEVDLDWLEHLLCLEREVFK